MAAPLHPELSSLELDKAQHLSKIIGRDFGTIQTQQQYSDNTEIISFMSSTDSTITELSQCLEEQKLAETKFLLDRSDSGRERETF